MYFVSNFNKKKKKKKVSIFLFVSNFNVFCE